MRFLWRLIIILGIFLGISATLAWANNDLDTSVVCLTLSSGEKLIEQNQFFELIDLGSYVLIPVNNLPQKLGLEIEYLRNQETLLVSSKDKQRQVKILLNEHKYFLSEQSVWEQEPPLVFKGSFYVTASLIEFLANVKVKWDYNQQELIVQGDWSPKPSSLTEDQNFESAENLFTENENVLSGSDYGLSLLRYESSTLYQTDNTGGNSLTETLKLRADGRIGAWSLAVENTLEKDLLTEATKTELSLIRALYNEKNHLIILGDTNINLERTAGALEMRGFLYMYPEHQGQTELLITTTVEGSARAGDKVSLFVNGLQLDEQVIAEGEKTYRFESVPLISKRINLIKIVLENQDGQEVIVKRVNANSRILKRDSSEYLLTYGEYREIDDSLWDGELLGIRTQWGLSDRFTLNTEAVRLIPENQMAQYGVSMGGAVKLTEGLSGFGDWLAGGTAANVTQGWRAGLLESFSNGYIEMSKFYVPLEVAENVRVDGGEGYTLFSEFNLGRNWSTAISGEINTSLAGMDFFELHQGTGKLGYAWGKEIRNSITGTFMQKDLLFDSEELGLRLHEDTKVISGEWQRRKRGNLFKNLLSYQNSDFYLVNGEPLTTIDTLGWYNETLYTISHSLWFGLNLESTKTWVKNQAAGTEVVAEAQLKKLMGRNSLTGLGTVELQNESSNEELQLFESKLSVIGEFELNATTNWQNTISLVNNRLLGNYLTARTDLKYHDTTRKNSLAGWLEYSTLGSNENTLGYQAGISLMHQFDNGLQMKLQAEHLFEDPWGNSQQNLFTFTLSQSIGFAKNKVHAFAYSEEDENLSFVSGVVYLDQNGNGKRDPNEKVMPGIEMKLNGRREKTDLNGKYGFYYLEPGLYQVGFDLRKLDADYTPILEEQLLMIKRNQNFVLDFGLTMNGVISGRVFIDRNANGLLDENEKGMELVGMMLDDGARKVFTDYDGGFVFENVPLGPHLLTVIPETLPQGMNLRGQERLEIMVTAEKLDHNNLLFPVGYQYITD